MNSLASFIGFQAAWFACVPGAAHGYGLLGPVAGVLWLGLFVWKNDYPWKSMVRVVLLCGLLGYGLDTLLTWTGIIQPVRFYLPYPLVPLWLLTLWVIMPSLFLGTMTWLFDRYRLASFLGAIGGPAAYWGGVKLGAVEFASPLAYSLLIHSFTWAIAFPLMLLFCQGIAQQEKETL